MLVSGHQGWQVAGARASPAVSTTPAGVPQGSDLARTGHETQTALDVGVLAPLLSRNCKTGVQNKWKNKNVKNSKCIGYFIILLLYYYYHYTTCNVFSYHS